MLTREQVEMKLGFTGTKSGMSAAQRESLVVLLTSEPPDEFHHGDCVGSDKEAHSLVRRLCPNCWIVGHPPNNVRYRAFCVCDELWPIKPYLDRDWDIARCADRLVATPKEVYEVLRSGTWTTVRYARKLDKSVLILLP